MDTVQVGSGQLDEAPVAHSLSPAVVLVTSVVFFSSRLRNSQAARRFSNHDGSCWNRKKSSTLFSTSCSILKCCTGLQSQFKLLQLPPGHLPCADAELWTPHLLDLRLKHAFGAGAPGAVVDGCYVGRHHELATHLGSKRHTSHFFAFSLSNAFEEKTMPKRDVMCGNVKCRFVKSVVIHG